MSSIAYSSTPTSNGWLAATRPRKGRRQPSVWARRCSQLLLAACLLNTGAAQALREQTVDALAAGAGAYIGVFTACKFYDPELFGYPDDGQWHKVVRRKWSEPYIKMGLAAAAGVATWLALRRILMTFTPEGHLQWQITATTRCAQEAAGIEKRARLFLLADAETLLQEITIAFDGSWPLVLARLQAIRLYTELSEARELLEALGKTLDAYRGDAQPTPSQKARATVALQGVHKLLARVNALRAALRRALGIITGHPHYTAQCGLFEQHKRVQRKILGIEQQP